MLAKSQRLNLKTSFRWVASGKSITSKNFKIFYREGENIVPKIGVSISSGQFKKATERNHAKRICFNALRPYYALLRKNLNLVIMPRSQVLDLSGEELEKEFKNALSSLITE